MAEVAAWFKARADKDKTPTTPADVVAALEANVNVPIECQLEVLPAILTNLNSAKSALQLEAASQLRSLLREHTVTETAIAAGVLPRLVHLLQRRKNPKLQHAAAVALTNVTSNSSEHTQATLVAVPILIGLFESPSDDLREQVVWVLGNIAGDSPHCRDRVLHSGILQPLLQQLCDTSRLSMLRTATWTLANLCRGKPAPPFDWIKPALPLLTRLLYSSDAQLLSDACWAFSRLSDGSEDQIQAVVETGACRRLVELLVHPSNSVQRPALRTVGNILSGNKLQTQVMLNVSVVPSLRGLLASPRNPIRRVTCRAIANITAGTRPQIQAVIDGGIIEPLVELLKHSEYGVKKRAIAVLRNATSGGSSQQIRYLVSQGCIEALCDALQCCSDVRLIRAALEALENILAMGDDDAVQSSMLVNSYAHAMDKCQLLDRVEELQRHENNEVSTKAAHIIERYFEEEEDVSTE